MKRSEVLAAFESGSRFYRSSLEDPQQIKDFDENYSFLFEEAKDLIKASEYESDFAWDLLNYWQDSPDLLSPKRKAIWNALISIHNSILKAASFTTREETKWEDEKSP